MKLSPPPSTPPPFAATPPLPLPAPRAALPRCVRSRAPRTAALRPAGLRPVRPRLRSVCAAPLRVCHTAPLRAAPPALAMPRAFLVKRRSPQPAVRSWAGLPDDERADTYIPGKDPPLRSEPLGAAGPRIAEEGGPVSPPGHRGWGGRRGRWAAGGGKGRVCLPGSPLPYSSSSSPPPALARGITGRRRSCARLNFGTVRCLSFRSRREPPPPPHPLDPRARPRVRRRRPPPARSICLPIPTRRRRPRLRPGLRRQLQPGEQRQQRDAGPRARRPPHAAGGPRGAGRARGDAAGPGRQAPRRQVENQGNGPAHFASPSPAPPRRSRLRFRTGGPRSSARGLPQSPAPGAGTGGCVGRPGCPAGLSTYRDTHSPGAAQGRRHLGADPRAGEKEALISPLASLLHGRSGDRLGPVGRAGEARLCFQSRERWWDVGHGGDAGCGGIHRMVGCGVRWDVGYSGIVSMGGCRT